MCVHTNKELLVVVDVRTKQYSYLFVLTTRIFNPIKPTARVRFVVPTYGKKSAVEIVPGSGRVTYVRFFFFYIG